MNNSAQIIYKGDVLASWFYIGIGLGMLFVAASLIYFNISLGFLYLSYGLTAFSMYCLGKGMIMFFIYSRRLNYYKKSDFLESRDVQEELLYTDKRILRKQNGRRIHVYIIILGSVIAFAGIFSLEKGLIMGTAIPVVLLSGIEFSIGLLTEFRLQEYVRILTRQK